MTAAEDALSHLRIIAVSPRAAGGEAEAEARRYCATTLEKAGFSLSEEPFEFSAFPGAYATPLAGSLAIAALLFACRVGTQGAPDVALIILLGAGTAIGLAATWLARYGVTSLALLRARSVNLVATRGDPDVWIMAHLDSKSQVVPIGVRAAAICVTVLVWVVAIATSAAQLAGSTYNFSAWWPWIGVAGLVGAIPVALTFLGARSNGALDNASGVAAALLTASLLPEKSSLGVIITSAEELGLAGARAWVSTRAPGTVMNFDGLDDVGEFRLMWTGVRPERLLGVLADAAAECGISARVSRLLPGILVDAVAFADTGWKAVTISKAALSGVARIHTRRDTMDHLHGHGIAIASGIAVAALKRLT
ncbi:MAG: M28 family peptidase [Gemmatimonadaceae bacterium]|nr:M28 family peptidase [Gemmatimonadaceae bacterium]